MAMGRGTELYGYKPVFFFSRNVKLFLLLFIADLETGTENGFMFLRHL